MRWDVEDELVAIAVLGDVMVDLAGARTLPPVLLVKAFALGRDVDVHVAEGTHVELSRRPRKDHLSNDVPSVDENRRKNVVYIQAHAGIGDVTVRVAKRSWPAEER
jgi:hypothetical protein